MKQIAPIYKIEGMPKDLTPDERKQQRQIDGAKASAIIYSIAETAKANHLKPYNYFEHLLTKIPKHMDDKNLENDLLPWSESLPESCKKQKQ